ncbi:helix-turn-helix domain-containing protein [Streptantibioticus ferralitis]|uniref:Pyridoxamine 5'-phosphate oxidase family protein n=1 Tax=Streptantibioticus ferralitis TaxID=236510 RepID=A0ABT5Z133_9ACTN|nr:pyridoxamine 5'-phosphate oxidase family protein [Streptantibioticus ferralitis]MDF2257488.1 pyridoxamine 5'-phosphate oxidase family protein [Streptantibioticus ferralitis]
MADRGDIGRRVEQRRAELGLTREELDTRARVAPGYTQYVEEHSVTPDVSGLLTLAAALNTSMGVLLGSHADLPPGLGKAAYHPDLVEMDQQECRDRLSTHGVGRVALNTADGLVIMPVSYTMADDTVAFRTTYDHSLATADGTDVAFEVDRIDEALSQGWSVLVVGRIYRVADRDTAQQLTERAHTAPWPGGEDELWMRIVPGRRTGRRIQVR